MNVVVVVVVVGVVDIHVVDVVGAAAAHVVVDVLDVVVDNVDDDVDVVNVFDVVSIVVDDDVLNVDVMDVVDDDVNVVGVVGAVVGVVVVDVVDAVVDVLVVVEVVDVVVVNGIATCCDRGHSKRAGPRPGDGHTTFSPSPACYSLRVGRRPRLPDTGRRPSPSRRLPLDGGAAARRATSVRRRAHQQPVRGDGGALRQGVSEAVVCSWGEGDFT